VERAFRSISFSIWATADDVARAIRHACTLPRYAAPNWVGLAAGWALAPAHWEVESTRRDQYEAELELQQCVLLRDIFGPWPFRAPPTLAEGVLAWNDGCVVKMASGIYDDRDFSSDRMGVLADALEEAGVTDEDVIGHCRQKGAVHVRGCWVVDLLTNRGTSNRRLRG
jgi:hypothetical protein